MKRIVHVAPALLLLAVACSQPKGQMNETTPGRKPVARTYSGPQGNLNLAAPVGVPTNTASIAVAVIGSAATGEVASGTPTPAMGCQAVPADGSDLSNVLNNVIAQGLQGGAAGPACLVQETVTPYSAGVNVAAQGLAPGTYVVVVALLDVNNRAIQVGAGTATVSTGQTTPLAIAMQTYNPQQTGNIDISICEPGAACAVGGTTGSTTGIITPPVPTPTTTPTLHFAFSNQPFTALSSACTPLTLAVLDVNNNPAVAPAISPTLTSTSATGVFATDAQCANRVTTVAFPAGVPSMSLFYLDTTTGDPTLTATDPTNQVAAGSQQDSIGTAGSGTISTNFNFVWTSGLNATVGACTVLNLSVEGGTTLPVAQTFGVTSSSASGQFFSDAICTAAATSITIPAGAAAGMVFYRDSVAGNPMISATETGGVQATAATMVGVISN